MDIDSVQEYSQGCEESELARTIKLEKWEYLSVLSGWGVCRCSFCGKRVFADGDDIECIDGYSRHSVIITSTIKLLHIPHSKA